MASGIIRKPPLGIMPYQIWLEQRLEDLKRCILGHMQDDFPVEKYWVDEYNKLIKELDGYDNRECKKDT